MSGKINSPFFVRLSFVCLGVAFFSSIIFAQMPPGAFMPPGNMPAGANPFQVSDAELQSLYGYLQNLDDKELEELERLSKQMLNEMGFDPETLQPLAPDAVQKPVTQKPAPPSFPEPKPKPPVELREMPAEETLKQVPFIIQSLIDHLSFLIKKSAASRSAKQAMQRWEPDINEVLYFLKIMNKPEHHVRLALPEFGNLIKTLSTLNVKLGQYEPLVVTVEKTGSWEDPYALLGIFGSADQEHIQSAYERLKKQSGPEAVRARLATSSLSKAEKEKEITRAALGFELITDAYEQLKDPKSRAIVDKERAALRSAQQTIQGSALQALDAILHLFGNAIYQDQMLNNLELFMKKYEPRALELRKKMLEIEGAQKKELEEYSRLRPRGKTIETGRARPGGYAPWGGGQPYGPDYGGRYYPPSGHPYGPGFPGGMPGGAPGDGGKTAEKSGLPVDKKAQEAAAAKEAEKKKQDQIKYSDKSPEQKRLSIDDLEIALNVFNKKMEDVLVQNALKKLSECKSSLPEEIQALSEKIKLVALRDEANKIAGTASLIQADVDAEKKKMGTKQDPFGRQSTAETRFDSMGRVRQDTFKESAVEARWKKLAEPWALFEKYKELIDAAHACYQSVVEAQLKAGPDRSGPTKSGSGKSGLAKSGADQSQKPADVLQQTMACVDSMKFFNKLAQGKYQVLFSPVSGASRSDEGFQDGASGDQDDSAAKQEELKQQRMADMLFELHQTIDVAEIARQLKSLAARQNFEKQGRGAKQRAGAIDAWQNARDQREFFVENVHKLKQTLSVFSRLEKGVAGPKALPEFFETQLDAIASDYQRAERLFFESVQETAGDREANTSGKEQSDEADGVW